MHEMHAKQQDTIYIVHGWAVNPNNEDKWEAFRSALKKHGVATVFMPLPGLSTPLDEVWTLDDYAHWLHAQLPAKNPVIVLGHSFGGQIIVRCNTLYPKLFSRIFLVDSAGIVDTAWKKRIKRGVFGLLAGIGKNLPFKEKARKLLYILARERDYYLAPEKQRETMSNVITTDITHELSSIAVPTMIVWGEKDLITPIRYAHIFHDQISGSMLSIIPEGRHSPMFTHPEKVAQVVLKWLT